jgi:hypothetical protein
MLALIVALGGGAGYSATGGNFILGRSNSASTQTALSASLNGRALQLTNTNTGGSAAALGLNVAAGHPPLTVNSAVRVANFNADKLDGLDSTQFPRKRVIPFNLAPGAISVPIAPPANQPVYVMGVTTTATGNGYGVGQVTLLLNAGIMNWTGLESHTPSSIAQGFSFGSPGDVGFHIVYLDYNHTVDIEVHGPGTIRVHNESATAKAGTVTFIW